MVTNRKKLKAKKRKTKFFVIFFIIIVLSVGIFTYFVNKGLHTRANFISPLAKIAPSETVEQTEKNKQIISEELKKRKIEFRVIEVGGNIYTIKLKDDSEIILSAKKDLIQQISSLQFILSRLTMEGKQFNKLDLQFDNPIIVFK